VTIEVRSGGRVVRRVTRSNQPAGVERAAALNTAALTSGRYAVRVSTAGARPITLQGRRL
jgi:hypothetical protein